MSNIFTIYKKELKDILRDKRTIMSMIVVPVLLYPALFYIMSNVMSSQAKKAMAETTEILVIDEDGQGLMNGLAMADTNSKINSFDEYTTFQEVYTTQSKDSIVSFVRNLIDKDKIQVAVWIPRGMNQNMDSLVPANLELYYQSTMSQNIPQKKVKGYLNGIAEMKKNERLIAAGLTTEKLKVFEIKEIDVATEKEMIGQIIGGILPYMFIAFCFMGAMYPAIDLGSGEKERGTLETILTSPASNMEILLGKIGVIATSGLVSALISLLGILASVQLIAKDNASIIPPEIMDAISGIIQFDSILLILCLLIPLTIFFASFLMSVSIYAKTFKEAQSIVTPMMIVIILPAIIGMLPGVELNAVTAWIPVVNVTLASKQIMAGNLDLLHFGITLFSLIFIAGGALLFSIKWFNRESNLLR